jgi:Ca-activated chloride channel homolog
VPVYAILVGTPNGVVEETLPGGFRRIIRVPPSAETLSEIAQVSGGAFYTAFDLEELRQVYEELGTRLGSRRETREITDLFAAGSAMLLLTGGAFSALFFRRVP